MHWTYEPIKDKESDLLQGDILIPEPELKKVIQEFHPYFSDSKYIGFLVLTQSCDLVRRKKSDCKAEYISLTVFRNLEIELPRILKTVCQELAPQRYHAESKRCAKDILSRILNQNEQSLGLFYLHPCADSGISDNTVAFLRISIAVKKMHYEILTKSRKGRLSPEFRDKLGWLTGNLYSRVGTKDWNETKELKREHDKIIDGFMALEKYVWIDGPQRRVISEQHIDPKTLTMDLVKSLHPKYLKDEIIESVSKNICKVFCDDGVPIEEKTIAKIENRLRNDPVFAKIVDREAQI